MSADGDVGSQVPGQGDVVGIKMKAKVLEAGQRREAGDHRLGWNVSGKGNTIKVKFDEMNGRH